MAEVALHCPKCHAGMASFRRSGILVEQCATCRGVFVTEAGLARLIDAGGTGHAMHAAPSPGGTSANGYHRQAYEGRHRRG
ncbi:zf-TFIIB domain-containing protein [Actinomadura alba]|uniref:Zf-TFIIB domain-containing protein n=1 Tax=Actinomadura alba TaxID=406431 RepID=A0ABR7LJ32_9ACTN|nr:zf-TFIIB domain-containing protein [Actinomadura alba]MBC6464594.1 zf-TFIIB domain-containing protein [Actinomadura alba]